MSSMLSFNFRASVSWNEPNSWREVFKFRQKLDAKDARDVTTRDVIGFPHSVGIKCFRCRGEQGPFGAGIPQRYRYEGYPPSARRIDTAPAVPFLCLGSSIWK